ncbi:metal-sensing transcriptional repressor, partial [Frigidibacter albus]
LELAAELPSRHIHSPGQWSRSYLRVHGTGSSPRACPPVVEYGRQLPCLAIAQQLQAVEKAVANAKRALIHDHMDHCLDAEHSPADRDELRAISRYL